MAWVACHYDIVGLENQKDNKGKGIWSYLVFIGHSLKELKNTATERRDAAIVGFALRHVCRTGDPILQVMKKIVVLI